MNYEQILPSYEELTKVMEPFVGHQIVIPIQDVGAAVYGFRVLDEDSGYQELRPSFEVPNGQAQANLLSASEREAALQKSKVYAWRKFGRDLSPTYVEAQGIGEMNRYIAEHPGSFGWLLPDGLFLVVDYSGAEGGSSHVLRMPGELYNTSPLEDKRASRGLYPNYSWPYVLGLEPTPQVPLAPSPAQFLRPSR